MKKACIICLAALGLLVSCNISKQNENKELAPPNILWITCEDMSPALACYGDPYASTPNLDQLAEEGVLFTRAYATAPICSPARSTLISGVYATTLGTQHLRSDISMPSDFKILPQYLNEAGYFCSNNSKTDYNFSFEGRWDDQGNQAHWRNREPDQPFFSVFNHMITHEGPTNSLSEEDVATLKQRHDPDQASLPPYFPDTPQMRKIWAHQYDLISVLDQQVGELLEQLKEDGLYENTIILFFSDHGFGMPRYKRWLYHTGLHVPLIVRVPEAYKQLFDKNAGSKEDRLVSFVDFAPTVLNLVGAEIPEHMAGKAFMGPGTEKEKEYIFGARSRADDLYEVSRCVLDDRFIYIRHFMPHQPYVSDAIIYSDMKAGYAELLRLRAAGELNPEAELFWQSKEYEELYDLQNDPHELNNLAADPEYASLVEEMQGILYQWMVEQRDVGLLNESDMMIRAGATSPYEMGASEAFPVEDVLKAANLCGNPEATVDEAVLLFDHADPAVRFWAVLSLYSAGDLDQVALIRLKELLKDPSLTVAVAAAELICQMGLYEEGLAVLARALQEADHPTLVLQASISLRNLKEEAAPLIPLINEVFPAYRGEVWGRYKDWIYPMFIGFALDQVYLNCGLEIPQ